MYSLLRPLLFQMDAEKAHALTLAALHGLPSWCFKKPAANPITALGYTFAHRIGLAAGLDKNGEHIDALAKLGFSFIEVGTVTPKPQLGNPKPRLFRLPQAQALINRMGFNNQGVDHLIANLKKTNFQGILGINIGKNKDTSLNFAEKDYLYCMEKLYPYASYITINISSPNTPDLRLLHQKDYFSHLLSQLYIVQRQLADRYKRHVPLVIKLSPDEKEDSLKEMAEVILKNAIEGIIISNTTCSREGVEHVIHSEEQGGLSGPPLFDRSTQSLQIMKQYLGDAVTFIASGGIDSVTTAEKKIQAGASLLQLYTGLIYKGPSLISRLQYL